MRTVNSSSIAHLYQNPTYVPRVFTDKLFEASVSDISFGGEPDRAVRFVERHQLMKPDVWALFVKQFRTHPDPADKGWRGEYWGKMMRGACWTYKYTKNSELYAVLEATVLDMLSASDADGRISSYTREQEFFGWDMWSRKYVLLGMQHFYDICKTGALKARMLASMTAQVDYIMSKIGDGKIDILDSSEWWGGLNSCSILEPIVRLYNLVGDKKYLDFASYIVESGGCKKGNIFALALENEKAPFEYPVNKAYEMMSFFEGVIEYYRVTGNEDCRRAFLNFIDKVIETDVTVIGCCGCTHELFDNSAVTQAKPTDLVVQETCVSVTYMKTCYQALCLTGDPKYADEIERTWYNAMLSSVNFPENLYLGVSREGEHNEYYDPARDYVASIGGFTFDSYSPLYKSRRNRLVGGYKMMENNTAAYGCCNCIGSAGTAILPMSAVMLSEDGIVINHYIDGSVTVKAPSGNDVTVRMETAYPYDGKVNISWSVPESESFALTLRIPAYVNRYVIDGVNSSERGYVTRKVEGSGSLTLDFELEFAVSEINDKVSLRRGIIVYALDERNADINAVVSSRIASVIPAEKDFDCRASFDVTFDNGTTVRMTDYASAGWDWSSGKSNMTAWMDTK